MVITVATTAAGTSAARAIARATEARLVSGAGARDARRFDLVDDARRRGDVEAVRPDERPG